jgi:para-nitrobenzyl esterase
VIASGHGEHDSKPRACPIAAGWVCLGHDRPRATPTGSEDCLTSGNYGLLDRIAALEWVHRNITAFGGDPRRVVLFGQSAGAISTAALYASPLARGLFAGAILHSGAAAAHPLAKSEAAARTLATRLGCAEANQVLSCLRARGVAEIVAALPESLDGGYAFGPTIDGWVLPDHPLALVRAGRGSRVPLIVGVTADEFTMMIGKCVDELIAFFGDLTFVCPSRRLARAASVHAPVRRFVFSHTSSSGPTAPLRAGHGLELPFSFRTFYALAPTAAELGLADAMIAAWSRFAATGDPASDDRPWPLYDAAADSHLALDPPIAPGAGFRQKTCDVLDSLARTMTAKSRSGPPPETARPNPSK